MAVNKYIILVGIISVIMIYYIVFAKEPYISSPKPCTLNTYMEKKTCCIRPYPIPPVNCPTCPVCAPCPKCEQCST